MSRQYLDGTVPAFLKQASADLPTANEPLSIFADPLRRVLPCHTKSATFMSTLYFYGAKANGVKWDGTFPETHVAARLEKAAHIHGITAETNFVREQITKKSTESKLCDNDFALTEKTAGETLRRFPVNTLANVCRSAQALFENQHAYPYEWRQKAASTILAKSAELGAELPSDVLDYIVKAAGMYPVSPKQAAVQLALRAKLIPDPEQRELVLKVAMKVTTTPQEEFEKLCTMLEVIDHLDGEMTCLRNDMPAVEHLFFQGAPVKTAGAENFVTLQTGSAYDLGDIAKAGLEPFAVVPDAYRDAVIAGSALDLNKAADVLPTMPRGDAQLFEVALNAVGVRPVDLEKSAAQPDIMRSDKWLEWFQQNAEATGDTPNFNFTAAVPLSHRQRPKQALGRPSQPLAERLASGLTELHAG